ncbi:MAG: DUF3307 domain-containing protein [Chitinophagaceae bacterium]|nr:DUF3307 domain-containing protein [Chitinophagaceae bacterium]
MENLTILFQWMVAHFLFDFPLQPVSWISSKKTKGFTSGWLYLHGLLHGAGVWAFTGRLDTWWLLPVVSLSHIFIDVWKVKKPDTLIYFLLDQLLHLFILLMCWLIIYRQWQHIAASAVAIWQQPKGWLVVAVFLFNIFPAAFLIQLATQNWRNHLTEAKAPIITDSLKDAGKWIGMLERIIILSCILAGRYEGVGILIAAKSVLRFNDLKGEHSQRQTEYVLIGTLLSFITGIVSGTILKLI